MKIYIDNELSDFRKIVSVQSSTSEDIHDDLQLIIDALKALGYIEVSIRLGFLTKCIEWGLVDAIDEGDLLDD